MIKSDDFGDVQPQFCFVRPRWCLSRTYVLSGEKKLFAALDSSKSLGVYH